MSLLRTALLKATRTPVLQATRSIFGFESKNPALVLIDFNEIQFNLIDYQNKYHLHIIMYIIISIITILFLLFRIAFA